MSTHFTEPPGAGDPKPSDTHISVEPMASGASPARERMSVSYANTFGDVLFFNFYFHRHSPTWWVIGTVLPALVFVAFFLLNDGLSLWERVMYAALLTSAALLAGVAVLVPAFVLLVYLNWLQAKTAHGRHTLALSDESFHVESTLTKGECKWAILQKIRQTQRYIFLFLGPATALMVPRRAFSDQDDFDAFYGFCEAHVDATALPQQASSGLIARATTAFRWLTTSLAGAAILTACGILLMCYGAARVYAALTGPDAPTKIAVGDLEKSSQPPPGEYLEITGGHLYWEELYQDALQLPGGRADTRWYYVPLVSKDVADEWNSMPFDSKLSYRKARVFLKISSSAMRRDFPQEINKPMATNFSKEKSPVQGSASEFKHMPKHMLKGMSVNAKDWDPDRMIVLEYGDEIPAKPTGFVVGFGTAVFGMLWMVPLGVVVRKRLKRSQLAAEPGPTSTAETPTAPQGKP